ncbi:MAG: SDR family oxidoreductase [Pseudomonadales bacterium]|nr:SDR family oxidoreductase [Pseudomonadales bacterium]
MGERLKDKVAVITGGTSGIGAATVELFVNEGASVVFCGRSEEKGRELSERVGGNVEYVKADVMSEADIERTIKTAVDRFGGLDILFNNAGGPTSGPITEVTAEAIDYAWKLLYASALFGIKHAVPHMEKRGGGSIINNSSIAALRDNQGDLLYSSIKAALTHYTRLAALIDE